VDDEEQQKEPYGLPLISFAIWREQETENLTMDSFLAGWNSYTPASPPSPAYWCCSA
jgi:hypothetical protein